MTAIVTAIPQYFPEQQATVAVTAASASVQLGLVGDTILFYNDGTNMIFAKIGTATVVAVAGGTATLANDGDMWMPPGAVMGLRIDPSVNASSGGAVFVAAICAAGLTSTLRISRGSGV